MAVQVFMLSADTVLDEETLMKVLRLGHSRVPVHQPGNRQSILGILLVKELVLLDPSMKVTTCPQSLMWISTRYRATQSCKSLLSHCLSCCCQNIDGAAAAAANAACSPAGPGLAETRISYWEHWVLTSVPSF